MKFPKEAPVFRLLEGGAYLAAGAIVELVEVDPWCGSGVFGRTWRHRPKFFGVRLLTPKHATSQAPRHPQDGWTGCAVLVRKLEPLTPFARELKAARTGDE
jgi:hypothetical protein